MYLMFGLFFVRLGFCRMLILLYEMLILFYLYMFIDDNLNICCFFDVIVEYVLYEDCVDVFFLSKDFVVGDVGDL